jgi:hypothetical protein
MLITRLFCGNTSEFGEFEVTQTSGKEYPFILETAIFNTSFPFLSFSSYSFCLF